MSVRVRFPPSPTGYLHVGGARTALFNWLFARRQGGVFVLRIEDTDRERSRPEHTEAILEGMRWLGLDWDEGPYFQSEGVERHRAAAERLLAEGHAYRDFTTPEEVARMREEAGGHLDRRALRRIAEAMDPDEAEERAARGEPFAIRFRVPDGATEWDDVVHGPTRFENAELDDLVILRSDGSPTYNLAVTSDDAEQGITHVLRGDDHLSNTPKQILLYRALGHPVPVFGHLPMILGPDGKRLSKRHGATAVGEYAREGYLPEAMVNFLALLGWSPGDDIEFMTRAELVERFGLERVLRKSAVFDLKKLDWLSGQHFNAAPPERLAPLVTPLLEEAGLATGAELEAREAWYHALLDLLKTRARRLPDIVELAEPFLAEDVAYEDEAVRKHWLKDPEWARLVLDDLRARLQALEAWSGEALEAVIRGYAEERGVGAGKVIHPLRVAVTGRQNSPGIFDVLVFLGRERTLERLARAIEHLSGGEIAAPSGDSSA